MEPKALLLDEPLGDLDRLLRLRMRVELRALQRQLGLMFIHVTHDQEEALSVGDRIVVMHEGRIEQVADPFTISNLPANVQVAYLHGRQQHLRRDGDRETSGDRISIDGGDAELRVLAPGADAAVGQPAAASVRSSAVQVGGQDASANGPNELMVRSRSSSISATSSSCTWPSEGGAWWQRCPATGIRSSGRRKASSVRLSWKEEDVRLLRS